jgi:tetratricopeptide (TPR) repeat protein
MFALDNKAITLAFLGKYKEAIKYFDKSIKIDDRNVYAWFNKYQCHLCLREVDKAMECLTRALRLDADTTISYMTSGAGRNLNSGTNIAEIEKKVSKKPVIRDRTPAIMERAIAMHNSGNFEDAINLLSKVLEENPNNFDAWFYIGCSLMSIDKKHYGSALESLDNALDIEPNNVNALDTKASILIEEKKYDEARKCLEKSLKINKNDAFAWIHMMKIYRHVPDINKANECLNKAMEVDPNYTMNWITSHMSAK